MCIIFLFALLLALSFLGCKPKEKAVEVKEPEVPKYKIGIVFDIGGKGRICLASGSSDFIIFVIKTTIFLEFARKPLVVNRPRALRSFNEKLSILMFPDLIAPTMISSDTEQILDFTRAHRLLR